MPSKNAQKLRQIERQLFFSKEANTTTALRCAHAAFKAAKLTRERRARVGAMGRSACYLRDIKSWLKFGHNPGFCMLVKVIKFHNECMKLSFLPFFIFWEKR